MIRIGVDLLDVLSSSLFYNKMYNGIYYVKYNTLIT